MKNVIIIGDSYSTHKNVIPKDYATFYSDELREGSSPVTQMRKEDTWWYKFISRIGGNLLLNDSWSGSTVGYTGYENSDCSQTSSFIFRLKKLIKNGFFENNQVDVVLLFGGTNDSWSDAPLGEVKTSDWKESDLYYVLPAIGYFIHLAREALPNAEIYYLINTEIKEEIANCIKESSEKFGVVPVQLSSIDKQIGHPTVSGMNTISEQILEEYYKNKR